MIVDNLRTGSIALITTLHVISEILSMQYITKAQLTCIAYT